MALIEDCTRCDGERYIEDGDKPCPRCNAPGLRVDPKQGVVFMSRGPFEVQINDERFDIEIVAMNATYDGMPVHVIPTCEA